MNNYSTEFEKEAYVRGREEFLKNPSVRETPPNPYVVDWTAMEMIIRIGDHYNPSEEELKYWAFESGVHVKREEFFSNKHRLLELKVRLTQIMEEFGIVSFSVDDISFKDGFRASIFLPEE